MNINKTLQQKVNDLLSQISVGNKVRFGSKSQKGTKEKAEPIQDREKDKDDFDGTNGAAMSSNQQADAAPAEEAGSAEQTQKSFEYRKGMKYQTMFADNRVLHESDVNLLPEGATVIKSVYESTYEQVSYIVQHDYEMIIYKDKDGKKIVSTYRYIPEYGWLLFLDAPKSQVYALTISLRLFMIIFAIIIFAMAIIFSRIARKQQKADQKLASAIVKSNKTKESLYTAMFKDVLTDVNNRISFSMEMDNHQSNDANPWYYAIFNIADFSGINSRFGNDTGDWLLVRTVEILKQVFKASTVYRTGSDEFVVVLDGGVPENSAQNVSDCMNEALSRLDERQNTPVVKNTFTFKTAFVKKTGRVNTSINTILKDLITNSTGAAAGQIIYRDLDR